MGLKKLDYIVLSLLQNGKPTNTPIAIVQNVTLKNQKIITSNLKNILKDIQKHVTITPAMIIIGEVVKYHEEIEEYILKYSLK